jgi:hypothetical protein
LKRGVKDILLDLKNFFGVNETFSIWRLKVEKMSSFVQFRMTVMFSSINSKIK